MPGAPDGTPAAGSRPVSRLTGAAEAFTHDLIAHPARYVPAAVPRLPFPCGRFDLVLSSHFLFTYADRLDLEFHRAALLELHRVARREVRVFPPRLTAAPSARASRH